MVTKLLGDQISTVARNRTVSGAKMAMAASLIAGVGAHQCTTKMARSQIRSISCIQDDDGVIKINETPRGECVAVCVGGICENREELALIASFPIQPR